ILFQTRWTLSYLRGPLTREQIQILMAPRKQKSTDEKSTAAAAVPSSGGTTKTAPSPSLTSSSSRPVVPPDVPEFFVPRRASSQAGGSLLYRPAVLGVARLHYAEKKAAIDYWETLAIVRRMEGAMPTEPWDQCEAFVAG